MKQFRITFGYDSRNRPKNRYFPTLEAAMRFADKHFHRTSHVLGIEAVDRKPRKS